MDKIALRANTLCIQNGARLSQPANVYIETASRQRESRGTLYVLLEPVNARPVPHALLTELTRTLAGSYYGATGSLTRGLRGALLAANSALVEHSARLSENQRVLIGINCIVVRGQDAYIGQIGPALLLLQHGTAQQGVLTRYPESSVWIRSASPTATDMTLEPPAGLRAEVEPSLSHVWLQPGDMLVMATTGLARTVPAASLAQAIGVASLEAASANLERVAGGRDISAVILQSPAAAQAGPSAAPEAAAVPPPVESVATGPRERPVAARESSPGKAPAAAAEAASVGGAAIRQGAQKVRQRTEDWLMRVLPDSVPEAPPEATKRERRAGRTRTRSTATRGAAPGTAGSAPTAGRAARTRSPRSSAAQGERRLPVSGQALLLVALLIPIVVLVLVVLTRVRYEETRTSQFDTLKVAAQAAYADAMTLPDVGQRREALANALGLAEDALSVHPHDQDLGSLSRRIAHNMNDLDVVQPLFHFWKLTDLADANTADAARIVLHESDLFVLNRGSDRVYHYRLNDVGDALQPIGSDSVLVQAGETRGGVQLGEMVDIAWLEAGGGRSVGTFVTLERGGTLLAYSPQLGIDALPVADSATWLMPQAIGSFFGNLYLLDPLLGQILKYSPVDNAYTNPPGDYLANELATDLTGAVDMAIDGNLYVLFADGRIVKFLQGEVRPFNMGSLPTAMRSPMSMFVSGEKKPDAPGYVYVADTGNDRIVQFDKEGAYVRQFRAQAGEVQLTDVRGLYVDEARGRIFFVSGTTLWLADIPALSR
ncbi:MAG: hypothetical protein GX557_16505 [Chloroflexi bacterium]|nr:hypothetical protein [Chloroflexota bacterium]